MANQLTTCIPSMASFIIAATLAIAISSSEARIGARSHARRKLQPDKAGKDAYTEIQCDWWQTMGLRSDVDLSGGLDQNEFLSFLNKISLDHFLVDGDVDANAGDSSWQNMFYELAKVDKVEEDSVLQVATVGFSPTEDGVDLDPKIQKENEKYRDEFCKSVFEGMLDEGVEVETMDLAIFTYELFEAPTVTVSDNILTTATATATTMAAATEFVTTNADEVSDDPEENLTASTSTVEDNSTITTLPTIGENSTIATSPSDEENFISSISQDNSTETTAPNIISTDESSPVSSTSSPPANTTATIPTLATSTSFDAISFDQSPPTTMTFSTAITTTTAATILSTTDATTTSKYVTSPPATKSSSTTSIETIPEPTTNSTSSTLSPFSPKAELASDIEKTIQIATSVEQVVIKSGGDGDSDVDDPIPQASTGMIFGVFAGVGSVVVLIVTAVTRHPYFDPSY